MTTDIKVLTGYFAAQGDMTLYDLLMKTLLFMFCFSISGKLPIIGVGGISTGKDAYDKIKAGASLVQLYTALCFEGTPIVKKIKRELAELVR